MHVLSFYYKSTHDDVNAQISFLTRTMSLWMRAEAWCVNYELQMFSTRCFVLNQALLYLKAKFNKTEFLKSPVVLLVKLLNHSPFTASQCQQNKTNKRAFFSRYEVETLLTLISEGKYFSAHKRTRRQKECDCKHTFAHIQQELSLKRCAGERDVLYTHGLTIHYS